MSARSALAERTLAPPAGTARPIAVLALRRARHHRLDRRRGRREGRRGRTRIIARRLRRGLAHGRAPARRFGGRRFGNRVGDLRRWRLLRPPLGRRVHIAARLRDRHGPRFALGDRGHGRLGRSRPVEIVDGACEFRLRRSLRREALALAAATVAPPAPPSAAPASALALAMCLCRPFGAATAVAGLVGLVRSSGIMLARWGSEVCGLSWRELVALVLERLAAFAAAAAAPPSAPSAALSLLAR